MFLPPIDPISLCPLWHKLHHTSYLVICHTTKPSKNNMVSRNPKIFRFYLTASVIVLVRASNKTIYFNHLWWPCCTSENPIKPIQGFMLFLRFYFYFSPKLTSASISTLIASRNSLGGIFFFNSTFIPRKHHYWFNWLTL